jgi:DNA invertase Pin-like site-specific DNA recombinase
MAHSPSRNIGYARELPHDQESLAKQVKALRQAGCDDDNIWESDASDKRRNRLQLALTQAVRGDIFMVARLEAVFIPNKLCRRVLEDLQRRQIHFCALDLGIDTRVQPADAVFGVLLFHLDTRHEFKSATTLAGMAKANAEGRVGGRRVMLSPEKKAEAVALIDAGQLSMTQIAERLGVSRSSLYNAQLSAAQKEKGRHGGRQGGQSRCSRDDGPHDTSSREITRFAQDVN